MEISIQSLHFRASDALTAFVTEKTNKLSHYYNKIESAKVCLKLERSDVGNKICEIRLAVPGNDLFTEQQDETFEAATNKAVDVLHQQLVKMKEKIQGI